MGSEETLLKNLLSDGIRDWCFGRIGLDSVDGWPSKAKEAIPFTLGELRGEMLGQLD